MNDDNQEWNEVRKRQIDMKIHLLDCENCESTKENDDEASLLRYQTQIGLSYFIWRNDFIKNSSSFYLEKLSSYPDGPELPIIGFDSLMNFTHPQNSSPFESNKQFFKESLVQSEIKQFWPTNHGYNSWFLLSQFVIRIRFTLYLYAVYQNQAAKDKVKITFCRIV